jgi:hypothetical protein
MAKPLIQMPDPATYAEPLPVRDDAGLRIWRAEGQTRRLVVCFSGIGRDGADAPPPPEFQRLTAMVPRDHLLFIADPARSWLNRDGIIPEITAAIEAEVLRVGATQVCTVGHSMGGYTAVVIPAFTRVDVALALSPQFAVDPALVPAELRWPDLRSAIPAFHIGNADDYVRDATHYFVIHGRHPREAAQRNLARPRPNLDLFVMPHTHHNTSQKLKVAGILDQLVTACFDMRTATVDKLLRKHVRARKAPVPAEINAT